MALNQDSMYNEASIIKEKAKRAIMPGIVAVIAALVFSFMFTYLIDHFIATPIKRIALKTENYHPLQGAFDAGIETKDELKKLELAIQHLIIRLKTR